MNLVNKWISYLDRSYEQIHSKILQRLGSMTPEITDHSQSNPFIIIVSILSGIAEVLHLYMDNIARESFLPTARKYSSVIRHVSIIGYPIHTNIPASADVQFSLMSNGQLSTYGGPILIPKNIRVSAQDGTIPFITTQDTYLLMGASNVVVPVSQSTPIQNELIGETSGSSVPKQQFPLSPNYVHNTLDISLNGEKWVLYPSFSGMLSTTKGVVVQVDENADIYLVFGDGIRGLIPPVSTPIIANYSETLGAQGNVSPGEIDTLESSIPGLPLGYELVVNNPGYAVGGDGVESIDQIKENAPFSIFTLNRAVTKADYSALAQMVPGVKWATVNYPGGKEVYIYISPTTKGIATQQLISDTQTFLESRAMITTKPIVKANGISRIWISATLNIPSGYNAAASLDALFETWNNAYGYATTNKRKSVEITELIALAKALPGVESIDIAEARIEPFVRPIGANLSPLPVSFIQLPHTNTRYSYRVVYKAATNSFEVYRNGGMLGELLPGVVFNDYPYISFRIENGGFTDNATWEFLVHPSFPEIFPDYSIDISDYSVPIIDITDDGVNPKTIFGNITTTVLPSNPNI